MSKLEKKSLIPAKGRTVSLENGKPWPTETKKVSGKDVTTPKAHDVEMSRYFRRRVRDGDLIDIKAAEEAAIAAQEAEKKKTQSKGGK